jgi:FAD synthetase
MTDVDGDASDLVVAQGTFDLIHPGHVHYLREAAAMGDRLVVIVARESNVTHKPDPICPAEQRREIVGALSPVDEAMLGDPEDIFAPIERLEPSVIALGYDQHHDEAAIETALEDRGIDASVRRASAREPTDADDLLSTGAIVERILERRGQ